MEVCTAVSRDNSGVRFDDVRLVQSLPALPMEHLALLDAPITATLTSHNPNGSNHHCPVWIGRDDTHLYLSSLRGQPNDCNLRERRDVTLLLIDPADPYCRLAVSGVVDSVIDEDHRSASSVLSNVIDQLGTPGSRGAYDPAHPTHSDIRVLYRIRPERLVLYRP